MGGYAWVTLATNDAYCLGILVLAHSLRRVNTKHDLVCLITPGVTAKMRETLEAVFSLVQEVNVLDSKDEEKLALLARPELGITFTKLHCWRLTQYEKCVFVDADTLVVQNCDELFEREELSAAPDVGWPDCFNSGVFVFRPSQETFASIIAFAASKGSFDGGDQGLLNMYFSDWATKDISKHLPFIYNMCSTATYSYLPAFKQFGEDVRIIHFIGITKPWLQYFDTLTGIVYPPPESMHLQPLLQLWFNIFYEKVHPHLTTSMATSTLAPIWHSFTSPSYVPPVPEYSVYSDTTNNTYSRTPDFSEFKDPWEEYSPQNETFPIVKSTPLECIQQLRYEEQQSSYTPIQTYEHQYSTQYEHHQHQEHVTSHFDENREHYTQHTQHHHWQQVSEQRHHDEHYQHNEHKHHDQRRHYHEQLQYHEQRHQHYEQHQHEQRHHYEQHHENKHYEHYSEQKPHNDHHQHSEQFQQHEFHRNKTSEYQVHQTIHEHYAGEPQSHFAEVRHEHHAGNSNQASHHHANHQNYTVSQSSATSNEHSQHAQDKFFAPYSRNEKSSKQSSEAANKQTDLRKIDSYLPSPAPCTDLHNVAMQSDPNVVEHLDSANAGIAGALAQMTLGQPRSAEQIAYEEHMRKQSWEQGQIDYMGRDSFDNIWKKITETLSLAPQRQPTPPKEDTAKPEESAAAAAAAEPAVKTPAPVDVEVNKLAVEADKDSTQSLVCEIPEEKISVTQTLEQTTLFAEEKTEKSAVEAAPTTKESSEPISAATEELKDVKTQALIQITESSPAEAIAEQCKIANPPTTQKTALQDESLLETKESQADVTCKKEVIAPVTQTDSAATLVKLESLAFSSQEASQTADAPTNIDASQAVTTSFATSKEPSQPKRVSEPTVDITQLLTIDSSEQHAEMLLAASEVSTVSPVPIQVAEAVLQAEPKESVLDTAAAASDQAIATTITAVHRSADISPVETTGHVQLNGSACESERRSDIAVLPEKDLPEKADTSIEKKSVSSLVATTEAPPVTEKKEESSNGAALSKESSAKAEQLAEQTAKEETKETKQIEKTEASKTKPAEQIAKTETVAKAEKPEVSLEIKIKDTATKSSDTSKVPESPITEQSPSVEESIKAKSTNIPSTPTVIEATPPTSPSAETPQELEEKTAKKDLKKSDSAEGADSENADKKTTKKTVKKVTKKPKAKPEEATSSASENAAADSSPSKPKKTVKVTKKTSSKTGLTLETSASVPETPPPPSPASTVAPDVPVPPKRKTKSSTSSSKGTIDSKKPDGEE